MNEPNILLESRSPVCDIQAFVEETDRNCYFYLWFYPETERSFLSSLASYPWQEITWLFILSCGLSLERDYLAGPWAHHSMQGSGGVLGRMAVKFPPDS